MTAALRVGTTFFEGFDLYGDCVTLRLDAVVTVMQGSRDGIAAYDADEADRKAHTTATGED